MASTPLSYTTSSLLKLLKLNKEKVLTSIFALIELNERDFLKAIPRKLKYNWSLKSSPNWFLKNSTEIEHKTQSVFAITSKVLLFPSNKAF